LSDYRILLYAAFIIIRHNDRNPNIEHFREEREEWRTPSIPYSIDIGGLRKKCASSENYNNKSVVN